MITTKLKLKDNVVLVHNEWLYGVGFVFLKTALYNVLPALFYFF